MRRTTLDKILAILVGIIVWAYVIGVKDPVTTGIIKSIPVELTNVSVMEGKGLAIAGTGEYTVDVVVGGNRSAINAAVTSDFVAKADVSTLTLGQDYITVEVEAPANLTINEIRTQKIQVYVDTAVSIEKNLKLFTSNVPEGKELGAIETEIGSVTVTGAQSLVEKVDSVQAAIDAASMELDKSSIQKINLVPIDADGNKVSGIHLSQNSVNIKASLYETKEVALNVATEGELNEHITLRSEIIPSSVVIKGPKTQIDSIWQLDTQPINKSDVTESCSIPVDVILPDGVELAHDYRNIAVVYEVIGRVEKDYTFTNSDVVFNNLDKGLKAEVADKVVIKCSVYEDQANLISPSNIFVNFDLSGLTEGVYNIPITNIEFKAESAEIIEMPETVEITITKVE